MRTMKMLLIATMLAGCPTKDSSPKPPPPAAPTPGTVRNLALDYVLSEEPDAKCTIYHQQAGPRLLDSVKCTLPNKRRIFVRMDTDATKVDRTDPPTQEEIAQAQAAQQQLQSTAVQTVKPSAKAQQKQAKPPLK